MGGRLGILGSFSALALLAFGSFDLGFFLNNFLKEIINMANIKCSQTE